MQMSLSMLANCKATHKRTLTRISPYRQAHTSILHASTNRQSLFIHHTARTQSSHIRVCRHTIAMLSLPPRCMHVAFQIQPALRIQSASRTWPSHTLIPIQCVSTLTHSYPMRTHTRARNTPRATCSPARSLLVSSSSSSPSTRTLVVSPRSLAYWLAWFCFLFFSICFALDLIQWWRAVLNCSWPIFELWLSPTHFVFLLRAKNKQQFKMTENNSSFPKACVFVTLSETLNTRQQYLLQGKKGWIMYIAARFCWI